MHRSTWKPADGPGSARPCRVPGLPLLVTALAAGLLAGCPAPSSPSVSDRAKLSVVQNEQPGSYRLAGVGPILGFAKGRDCTFMHCLELVLAALGQNVGYDELMGLSGMAFRIQFRPDRWDVGNSDPLVGRDCLEPLLQALGWEYEVWVVRRDEFQEAERRRQAIIRSLRAGVPVLAANVIPPEDWGIITGYQQGNQDWYCRSYNGGAEAVDQRATGWPTAVVILTRRGTAPPAQRMHLDSIARAVKMWDRRSVGVHALGRSSFDHWCQILTSVTRPDYVHANAWTYISLIDARQSAARYLRGIAGEFGAKKDPIMQAAAAYEREAARLTVGLADVPWESQYRVSMPPAVMRNRQIATLREAQQLEEQAIGLLRKAM